jgi:hypothetical protein
MRGHGMGRRVGNALNPLSLALNFWLRSTTSRWVNLTSLVVATPPLHIGCDWLLAISFWAPQMQKLAV